MGKKEGGRVVERTFVNPIELPEEFDLLAKKVGDLRLNILRAKSVAQSLGDGREVLRLREIDGELMDSFVGFEDEMSKKFPGMSVKRSAFYSKMLSSTLPDDKYLIKNHGGPAFVDYEDHSCEEFAKHLLEKFKEFE